MPSHRSGTPHTTTRRPIPAATRVPSGLKARANATARPPQRAETLAAAHVPEDQAPVRTRRSEEAAVGAEGDALDLEPFSGVLPSRGVARAACLSRSRLAG